MATEAEPTEPVKTTTTAPVGLGDLHPANRSEQHNTSANPACACKTPPKHGAYHQLSYTPKARSRTKPVHPAPLHNYQKLQALLDELLEASIDLDRSSHGVGRRSTTVTNHAREAFTSNPHPPIHPHALGSVKPL